MSFFHQSHNVKLNNKGRFVFPSTFRNDVPPQLLNDNFWISPSIKEGYLIIRPEPIWKQYIEQIENAEVELSTKREFLEILNSTVDRSVLDGSNRLSLSQQSRELLFGYVNEENEEVKVFGRGKYFEICRLSIAPKQRDLVKRIPEYHNIFEGTKGDKPL